MPRQLRSLISTLIIVFVFWLIWSRLHIVIWVQMPWWGLLLLAIALYLVIDYGIDQMFGRRR
ncbi:hypothetical protein [Chloroflexus sp.]|uniref:hypothetical protein n=1 Tax=Chloroflexus sp. TaxID=1904827 RepID=UPI00298EFFD4|nr:hypothetical protein [Chloroflexus sp.]MCS6886584.1 hypothetical protein [Chloroflexus sp.]MCX7858912.1 hypothetical protein [Chloroflexus sp.]MDW8403200.1 hypothetical protein [Chloroflexus sp.]